MVSDPFFPGVLSSDLYTQAFGINNNGQVVGSFRDTAGWHGFVETGGVYTVLDVPGVTNTQPMGINIRGQVAGYIFGAGGPPYQGFVANPVPIPIASWLFGSALTGLSLFRKKRRRLK